MAGFAQARSSRFIGLEGNPIFFDVDQATTPGSDQTLINEVTPAGKKRQLSSLFINCCQPGEIKVFKDAQLIQSGYTSPGEVNVVLNWFPFRPIASGESVVVVFRQFLDTPITTVRCHLQLTEI